MSAVATILAAGERIAQAVAVDVDDVHPLAKQLVEHYRAEGLGLVDAWTETARLLASQPDKVGWPLWAIELGVGAGVFHVQPYVNTWATS